jgi:hypothetical protein
MLSLLAEQRGVYGPQVAIAVSVQAVAFTPVPAPPLLAVTVQSLLDDAKLSVTAAMSAVAVPLLLGAIW